MSARVPRLRRLKSKKEHTMRFRPPLRVNVTRHEEKEHKLQEFLSHYIARLRPGGDAAHPSHLLLVARSLDSPVVKAITALGDDIAAAGLGARLILAHVDREPLPEDWGRGLAFTYEIRWARHPRLVEAHEQLVLGPETCWIGDCMRRDPGKCDAYESYVEDCGEAAGCAAVSFERLWHASQPLVSRTARRTGGGVGSGPMPVIEAASQATAGTRH
jgi:hypothetical protein